MYKPVSIGVSQKQMSKLRNGHKVRVKPAMSGEGVCLIVNPENYSLITRTFSKGKGSEISLSPEELMANRNLSPEEHQEIAKTMNVSGGGIFGKKFDRGVANLIGKNARREIYKRLEEYKPLVKGGITTGLTAGATALGTANPALIPYLPMAVGGLSSLAYDYLDRPSYYQGHSSSKAKSNASRYLEDETLNHLNSELGTNMGYLSRAGVESALMDKYGSDQISDSIERKQMGAGLGLGLYAGGGLGLGMGGTKGLYSRTGGAIGLNGGMVQRLPPALQSQPYGQNFQFQFTLPPAYQKLKR